MIRWTIEARDDGSDVVAIAGEITAQVDFAALLARRDRVVLDLAGVRRLNSRGVHQFSLLLEELAVEGPIAAERCSVAVIRQMNLVPSIGDRLEVRSLFLPFECPGCFREEEVLVDKKPGRRPEIPATTCPTCATPMVLAETEERYFAFLTPA